MPSRKSALLVALLAAGGTAAAGCEGKGSNPAAAAASASASAANAAASARAMGARVSALARAAAPCTSYENAIDSSCPAMKVWSESRDDFAGGDADGVLVAMLADPDEKMRYLAAFKLNQSGRAFKTVTALAEAVVGAAEKETSKFAGFEVGVAVGRIRVKSTGTFDRIKVMVDKHPLMELRRGIVSDLLFDNQDDDAVFALLRGTVKDPDKVLAMSALQTLWTGATRRGAASCQLYADNIDSANDEIAAEASNQLSWFKQCSTSYDALLASLEKRVAAGPLTSISYVTAARHVCEDEKATPEQDKRAAALGRAVAGRKEGKAWIRSAALETVLKCDASDGGRAFVGKFQADPVKSVADQATTLLAKK